MHHRNSNGTGLLAVLAIAVAVGCDHPRAAEKVDGSARPITVLDDDALRQQLDRTLDLVFTHRRLNARDHAAWQVVHGAVAFGRAFPLEREGRIVSAVDFLLAGGQLNGWTLEPGDLLGERRGLRAVLEPGSKIGQGHSDQWLGYLSGCELPLDQTIQVGETGFTMADLVAQVEWDVPRNLDQEYSWTLMGLTAYRPPGYQWTASDGKTWTISRLVEIEAAHDLHASACGGTHRLCGLALAMIRHAPPEDERSGPWQQAADVIQQSLARAREYQNADGSLSSNYLERPGRSADLAESLGATGHVLEFVVLAAPESELRAEWIQRAALYVCDVLERTKDVPLECGALYHATSGLAIYRQRLFGRRSFSLDQL